MKLSRKGDVGVLVLSSQYPQRGNPTSGIFVQEQVAALRRAGVDARVLVGRQVWLGPSRPAISLDAVRDFLFAAPRVEWREQDGAIYAEFPAIVLGRLGDGMRSLCYAAGLGRVLRLLRRDFPFALVHAHTALLDGAAAIAIKRALEVPVVLTEHTGPFSVITRTSAMRRRVQRALLGSDGVVAVSQALVRMMRAAFPSLDRRIEIIPNGVNERLFRPAARSHPVNARKTMLWIGALEAAKRPLLALTAFAAIAGQRPDFDLQMIGEGSLEEALRLEVERLNLRTRVRIDGHHDRAALAGAISRARVLLVTSAIETFSLVTIEALSSGIPVVSTRCGGPEDILVEPWLGRLSDDSLEALTAALLEITSTLADFRAERLRAYAIDRFGMKVVAERYIALYQEVMSGFSATTG